MRMHFRLSTVILALTAAFSGLVIALTGFTLSLPSFTEFMATASPLALPSLLVAGAVAAVAWLDPAPFRAFWSRLMARVHEPVPRAL